MSLYRRPGSPYYWSKLHIAGNVVRFSTRERTKTRALHQEREHAEKLRRIQKIEGRYTVATLAAKLAVFKQGTCRDATVTMIKRHLRDHVVPFFGAETDVRMIDVAELKRYRSERAAKVAAVTVNKELSTVRQLLKYATEEHGIFEIAPTVRNLPHRYEIKGRALTEEQLAALLSKLADMSGRGKEALPYFLLRANTGLRHEESKRLTWEMIDLAHERLHLPASASKTKRARTIDLSTGALAALEMMPGSVGRVFRARGHYDALRAASKAAGIPGRVRPHDLRHTLASRLYARGASGPQVRDILGHVTLAMANIYAHTYGDQLKAAVESVSVIHRRDDALGHNRQAQ